MNSIDKNVILDFNQKQDRIFDQLTELDANNRTLTLDLRVDGQLVTLDSGDAVSLEFVKPDGTQILWDSTKLTVTDNRKVTFAYDENMTCVNGVGIGRIVVTNTTNQSIIRTTEFKVKINKRQFDDAGVISTDDYQSLQAELLEVQTIITNGTTILANCETATENANEAITDVNTAISNANTATENANTATSDCVNATSSCSETTTNCNTAISNANAATDRANTAAENAEQYVGGDISSKTVTFTEATTYENISTGESTSVLFGKIKKWFTDILADFKGVNNTSAVGESVEGYALDARQNNPNISGSLRKEINTLKTKIGSVGSTDLQTQVTTIANLLGGYSIVELPYSGTTDAYGVLTVIVPNTYSTWTILNDHIYTVYATTMVTITSSYNNVSSLILRFTQNDETFVRSTAVSGTLICLVKTRT